MAAVLGSKGTQSPVNGGSPRLDLPPGWEQLQSDKGPYYWHRETNTTRWKFPEQEAAKHRKIVRSHNYVNVKPDTFRSSSPQGSPANSPTPGHRNGHTERAVASPSNGGKTSPQPANDHTPNGPFPSPPTSDASEGTEKSTVVPTGESRASPAPLPRPSSTQSSASSSRTATPTPAPRADKPVARPEGEDHNYVNVPLRAELSPSSGAWGISPEDASSVDSDDESESGRSSVSSDAPRLPERGRRSRSGSSEAPSLPDRQYSSREMHSPTPPVPDRNYPDDGNSPPNLALLERSVSADPSSPPPPPIPKRVCSLGAIPAAVTATTVAVASKSHQNRVQRSLPIGSNGERAARGERLGRGRGRKGEELSRQPRLVARLTSEEGDEYALVNPCWRKGVEGRSPSMTERSDTTFQRPPSVELAGAGKSHESSPTFNSSRAEAPYPAPPSPAPPCPVGASSRPARDSSPDHYIDLDLAPSLDQPIPEEPEPDGSDKRLSSASLGAYGESIAYAVVKLESFSSHEVRVEEAGQETQHDPEPYEIPFSPRGTISYLSGGSPPSPSYAEISSQGHGETSSNSLIDSAGYTCVKDAMAHAQAFSAPSPSQPPRLTTTPPSPRDSAQDSQRYALAPTHRSASVTSPPQEEREKAGRSSHDSARYRIDSMKYDLPLNSRKLAEMNVTIRRSTEGPGGSDSSYSKLGLSRQMLLLRSGVTLQRMSRASLSSLKPLMPEEGEGEEEEEDEEEEGGSSEEEKQEGGKVVDGNVIDKCIHNLETSLRQKEDSDNTRYAMMEKPPISEPKWMNYQRKPHPYEDIKDEGGASPQGHAHLNPALSRSMTDLETEMSWDTADLATPSSSLAPDEKKSSLGRAGSASQPNLTQNPEMAKAFPHLKRPERVSEVAYNLRQLRLSQHTYEDVDIREWPEVGDAPGDVGELVSVMRESWTEGGEERLPKGWQCMKDDGGNTFYWHVPSGKTQYTKPTGEELRRQSLSDMASLEESVRVARTHQTQNQPDPRPRPAKAQTFSVRFVESYGVAEAELVPGKCVKVVHSCISRTITAREGRTIKGKPVFLQVRGMELRWLEPETSSPTCVQPINRIRVWGIGLENDRDFGYVARDQVSKKHKCHVFRCDMPARAVARALLESHQRDKKAKASGAEVATAKEDSLVMPTSSAGSSPALLSTSTDSARDAVMRVREGGQSSVISSSVPQQSADHYTKIACTYIGSCDISKAFGMEVLNEAVERLSGNRSRWIDINLEIASSHIRITDSRTDRTLHEHRVRFLCFLGIATDDKFCGYILDSGDKRFQFHGFRKEPNTDRLCLSLHTACQQRYRRVRDAHQLAASQAESQGSRAKSASPSTSSSSSSASSTSGSLFGRLGSLKKSKKDRISEPDRKPLTFVVQLLGSRQVSQAEGLETIKKPVQELSARPASSANPPHFVNFEVTPSGLSLEDPSRKSFARKSFAVKHITYVVRIRNHFAFIVREGGKYNCYVFLESKIDAGTVVTTVQRLLAPDTMKTARKK